MSSHHPCARTRRVRRLASMLLLCLPAAAAHAAAAPLGFAEAIRLAVERAPLLDAQRGQAAAAVEEVGRADALPDPRLVAGIQNLPIGGMDAFTLGADRMTMRRIGLSQEFPSRAKRAARRLAAEADLAQARAETLAAGLDVRRATAEAWIALWAAERERAMLQALAQQSELVVRAARARLSGGGGSATDVLAARSATLELENRLDATGIRIAQARAELARWLGSAPAALAQTAPEFSRAPVDQAVLLAQLDRHGALLVWDAREDAAAAALELERAELRPDWGLSGGYAQRGAGGSDVVWLELSIDLPLFTADRQDRGVAARRAQLGAVHAAREDARRAQAAQVRSLFAQWSGLGDQVRRYRSRILPLAEDRSRTALAAYSGGDPLQAWIAARRDELTARVDYARTLAQWGRAWAALAWLLPEDGMAAQRSDTEGRP